MQLEVGNIVEGKVVGITNFGAFVELDSESTGLVHISEVSNDYVKEVSDYVKEGDTVKVKILSVDGSKISLSIKQASPKSEKSPNTGFYAKKKKTGHKPLTYRGTPKKEEPTDFEDMLARFKQNSEEKMSDIKRNMEGKRGSYSRKR